MQTTTAKSSFVNAVSLVVKDGGMSMIAHCAYIPISATELTNRIQVVIHRSYRFDIPTNDI